jgi:hypothetical protein
LVEFAGLSTIQGKGKKPKTKFPVGAMDKRGRKRRA